MPKGKPNRRYTPEFKIRVVETMHREKLSYHEAARQFNIPDHHSVAAWERIYLEEGAEGLRIERRGRKSTGRTPKLEKKVEEDLIAEVQRLRAENAYLKKIECLGCREGTAREKAQVIWELRHEHKVGLLIDIAGIPRSTYYYYSKQFENPKPDKYAEIKEEIRQIYNDSKGRYGYRRITKELQKAHKINHKTVQRLMRKMGIFCRVRMKKYNSFRGEAGRTAPNLLERNFKTDAPNQKWVTDVTEFSLFGTKLYLSPIIDLFNGEVVAYDLSYHPNLKQVTNMLEQAFAKIPDGTGLILHSDQGWQYQHKHYQKMLKDKGVQQSMSRKGNCLDNACAENFFGLLKTELLYLQEFDSVEHFIAELKAYIEWYNTKRIKLKLDGLSPVEFRLANAA